MKLAWPPEGSQASPQLHFSSTVFAGSRGVAAEPGYSGQHCTQPAAKHTPDTVNGVLLSAPVSTS